MKKYVDTLKNTIACLLVLGICFGLGYWKAGCDYRPDAVEISSEKADIKLPTEVEKRTVTVDEIAAILEEADEFSTYLDTYHVTRSEDECRYLFGNVAIWGTKNQISLDCKGVVKIGYCVDDIEISIDDDDKKISVVLPEPSINDNYIIWDTVQYSENNNILNPIEFDQYRNLMAEIEKEGLEKAIDDGIYEKAEEHMKTLIRGFWGENSSYEITFL